MLVAVARALKNPLSLQSRRAFDKTHLAPGDSLGDKWGVRRQFPFPFSDNCFSPVSSVGWAARETPHRSRAAAEAVSFCPLLLIPPFFARDLPLIFWPALGRLPAAAYAARKYTSAGVRYPSDE